MPNVMAALANIGGASVQCCKVWLMPTTRVPCSNAAKMRNPLKFAGCPKLPNRSQLLVGRSSPYCEVMWGRYCCLTGFFRLSTHALVANSWSGIYYIITSAAGGCTYCFDHLSVS